jgi:hypothetical protein
MGNLYCDSRRPVFLRVGWVISSVIAEEGRRGPRRFLSLHSILAPRPETCRGIFMAGKIALERILEAERVMLNTLLTKSLGVFECVPPISC